MNFFSFISPGEVHPTSEDKIIPAEDFSILMQCNELLKKAKSDIKNQLHQTEIECEKLKEEAKQVGFQNGLEQFNAHILSFERSLQAIRLELEKQIIPLALKAAKKIVGAQLELKPDTIVDIIIQALAPVLQHRRFTIYVNKSDKEILETQKPKIKNILEQMQVLSIQERNDISPGGCIIETESGIINATIENQWRALESAFEKYMK